MADVPTAAVPGAACIMLSLAPLIVLPLQYVDGAQEDMSAVINDVLDRVHDETVDVTVSRVEPLRSMASFIYRVLQSVWVCTAHGLTPRVVRACQRTWMEVDGYKSD